jgi:hypothetical protein
VSLSPSETPDLLDQDAPTSTSPAHTLFLKIDLKVEKGDGKPVQPMTAVFAPDPKLLTTPDVDVLLWFHGDKRIWSKNRKDTLDMSGTTVQDYIKVDECKLREFILRSSKNKKNFLLVVPTLSDRTGAGAEPGGLLWKQDQAEAFLQQVLNGVQKYMGKNVTGPKNVVLAAHSGGGHLLGHMAQSFGGMFEKKVTEIWCFDCTYWGGFKDWAKKGHSDRRLWIYSTGEGTAYRLQNPKLKEGPDNPKNVPYRSGTGDTAKAILEFSKESPASSTTIEVLIEMFSGSLLPTQSTANFVSNYGIPDGKKHYECIEKYLTQLVDSSNNLE